MSDKHLRTIVQHFRGLGYRAHWAMSGKHPKVTVEHPSGPIRFTAASTPACMDDELRLAVQRVRRVLAERGMSRAII